jgi:acetolactate synthase I/II/III large subunit
MSDLQLQPVAAQSASKGSTYIVDFLVRQGVPFVFGLCGHGNIGLLDGLYDRQQDIKTISVHHESAAAFMADAYFRIRQKPVATLTSCGPGSANLIVAIAAAFADSSAMLSITETFRRGNGIGAPFRKRAASSKETSSM